MKMNKLFCVLALAMGLGFGAAAQSYDKSIGVRIAPDSYYDVASLAYKFFITEPGALELNAGFGLRGYYYNTYANHVRPFALSISGAYQHHFEIPVRNGGLYWFIGGGLTGYRTFSDEGSYDGFAFGLFPTGGADYKIPNIPLSVSVDYRPTFFVTRPDYYDGFWGTNLGLSARYIIGGK